MFGTVITIFKVALLIFSIYSLFSEVAVLKNGVYSKSTVSKIECNLICFPEIQFTTQTGQTVNYKFNLIQGLISRVQVGQNIEVIYNSSNAQQVIINNFLDKYLGYILLGLFTVLAILPIPKWLRGV